MENNDTELSLGLFVDETAAVGLHGAGILHGQPLHLLAWLETQLGLAGRAVSQVERIAQYAARLETIEGAAWVESMEVDRWATAAAMLERRDALRMAAWSGRSFDAAEGIGPLLRDIAAAEQVDSPLAPGVRERIDGVMEALEVQTLPPHMVLLHEAPEMWPAAWHPVLAALSCELADAATPSAREGSSLYLLQEALLSGRELSVVPDGSLRMGQAHSDTEAIRAVVEWVAAAAESAGEAVLICEDAALALRIDEALVASGLPSMGVPDPSPAGPILQVLPLALALCWDPVAPELLLDFLSLPTRPVRARAARKLAHALEEQPGLGSGAWTSCVAELTSFEADPKGEVAERIETWLECSRAPAGEEIRTSLVRSRCSEVSRWAAGYAAHLRAERPDDGRVPSLEQLAARAALVGELAEAQGRSMTEPQLARLHEACARHGGSTASRAPEAGCVRFVSSAADLHPPCARVVWLGHGTSVHLAQPWSRRTIEALQRAGLAIDDGAARAAGLRSAERRGLAVVEESLLMVSLPRDAEERPHPLWTRVRAGLRDERGADLDPVPLSEVLEGSERMAPWSLRALSHPVAPPHGIRTLWTLPPGSFEERAYRSATEVQTRLACPLKWVLEYAASIRPSPIANLPDSFLLKGSFCHQVLERVLSEYVGVRVPVEEVVARTRAVFDERVALDAAPLATRAATTERMALRESLTNSVSTLWALIEGGRYVLDALEAEVRVSAPVEGDEPSALLSFVDCVLRDEEGRPAVVDFKYAGAKKYPTLLKEGRALQLAFYARALGAERSVELADIRAGYLIIDVARLFTPEGSSLLGAGDSTVEDAPPISETWETLRRALAAAEGWLREGEAVPARPLQAAEDRPEGAEIALGSAAELKKGKVEACRYCAYPALCGLRGLQ